MIKDLKANSGHQLRSIILICISVWPGMTAAQTPHASQTLAEVIEQIDAVRARFDRCYFEYYADSQHDDLAREHGWRNSPSLEWRKIARDGEKRYSHRKSTTAADAKIKYSDILIVSAWDGESMRILEHKQLQVLSQKSPIVEENYVFFALGWPVHESQKDPEQVFVPSVFRDPQAEWELSSATIHGVECHVISSSVRQMQFWFDKETKMPRKYEFQRSRYWPNNQTREFLDYTIIADDGTQFPQKVVISGDLYSPKGEYQGNFKTQYEIANSSLKPDPQLFVLEGEK